MFSELVVSSLLALTAMASPHHHAHRMLHRRDASNFTISVVNNCSHTIHAATYSMSDAFIISQESATHVIEPDCSANVTTNYYGTGMRLSPNANLSLAEQYLPQAMFEYGYSAAMGVAGTAYDISMMGLVGPGMEVVPANPQCEKKCCTTTSCSIEQGWTSATQAWGADTTCYYGQTDFTVTFCPAV